MTRFLIGDLRTGRRIQELPVLDGSWSDPLNEPETVSATADLNDPGVISLGLRASATPAKSFLVCIEGNRIMGGPIWTRDYDRDARTLDLKAMGIGSIFDHRTIIPLLAASLGVTEWIVPDPADESKTMPNPALRSSWAGIWLGTIAKRAVQQAIAWAGGELPIVFQSDEADGDADHVRNVDGVDFKSLGDFLADLTDVDGGPDINFLARMAEDLLGVEWLLQTGTAAKPQVSSDTVVRWNVTAPLSPVSGLKLSEDASGMASLGWGVGGRKDDTVLVSRVYDPALVDAGYPLMETVDTSHSSVEKQATLDGYTAENVAAAQTPQERFTFDVKAYPVNDEGEPAGPQFGSYVKGDICELDFQPFDEDTGVGDIYFPEGGTKRMRILGLSGDADGDTIGVNCAPVQGV